MVWETIPFEVLTEWKTSLINFPPQINNRVTTSSENPKNIPENLFIEIKLNRKEKTKKYIN